MAFDAFFASEFLVVNEHHCGMKNERQVSAAKVGHQGSC